MDMKEKVIILLSILSLFLINAQGVDKYTDGNRPYEFGFSIDGEQHRHEKKDEKGLIEGEFGFITADGVYHVTVYATDEEGRFKILSMKNIRVKPYPTYTAKQTNTSARQGHSLDLPASPPSILLSVTTTTTTTFKPISIEPPAKSCSHCSLPTTSTASPVKSLNQPINNQTPIFGVVDTANLPRVIKPQSTFVNEPIGNTQFVQPRLPNGLPLQANKPQQELLPPQIPQYNPQQDLVPNQYPQVTLSTQNTLPNSDKNVPKQNLGPIPNVPIGVGKQQENQQGSKFSNSPGISATPAFIQQPQTPSNLQDKNLVNSPNGRTPKRLDGLPAVGQVGTQQNSLQKYVPNTQSTLPSPIKPSLISAQMQIVNKNTDIHRLNPGEKEGLPKGLTKDHLTQLLYTFNYTVGFHGHFEEGYTDGTKHGYYFVTGRNGIKTRVDYTADSEGFHPKISQEVLDLISDDVPKPETEKEEKYGLKGYEFKWLYYPVESKGR